MKNSGWDCQIDKYADRRNEKKQNSIAGPARRFVIDFLQHQSHETRRQGVISPLPFQLVKEPRFRGAKAGVFS